jgi:hypothetical protein
MKPAPTAALCATIAISAFVLGRWSSPSPQTSEVIAAAGDSNGKTAGGFSGKSADRSTGERPMNVSRLSEQGARRMSPEERLNLLSKGALIFDGSKQADMLCGVLSAMTKEEMRQAMDKLAAAQDGGNACAQAVWDTLWTQWGRVDPLGCIEYFAAHPHSKSRSDARFMMQGWLEMDPDAALAWAKEPKDNRLDAAAAAMAITWNSSGDPKRLEAQLLSMADDSPVKKECLLDYFDLASLDKSSPTAADIHENLPASLKEAAWPVTLQRLTYTDPQAAKTWLEQHAGDPGQDYGNIGDLVMELARQDVGGTAKWAAGLPAAQGDHAHPAEYAISIWISEDREAAQAWIATLPPDTPWERKVEE